MNKIIKNNSLENLYNAPIKNNVLISGRNSNIYKNGKKIKKLHHFKKKELYIIQIFKSLIIFGDIFVI